MHETIKNLLKIEENIKSKFPNNVQKPKIIAVSKTFKLDHIKHLIEYGHKDYGEKELNKKLKIFIQVNIGNEKQKSGVDKNELLDFYNYCKNLELNIIGLMCIPPLDEPSEKYFKELQELNKKLNLNELSMGMSSDYINAIENGSTQIRIGSNIFGNRN